MKEPRKLTRRDVYLIKHMALNGRRQVEIAKKLGMSEEMVSRVLRGEREAVDCIRVANGEPPSNLFGRGIARCPSCGAKVLMPCIECRLKEDKQHKRIAKSATSQPML